MLLSFLPDLHFSPEFFSHVGRRFDKIAKIKFKIDTLSDEYWKTRRLANKKLQYTCCSISQEVKTTRK